MVLLVCSTALAGCGDDGGGNEPDASAGGGGAGSGPGSGDCSGEISGDIAAGFSGCVSAINAFPEGTEDRADASFIYTLVAAEETMSALDEPVESLGINLFIDGTPEPRTYRLADAHSDTMAHVYAPYPVAYEELTALQLAIDELDERSSTDALGYPTVLYELHGSFEMTLADENGDSVTVSATF